MALTVNSASESKEYYFGSHKYLWFCMRERLFEIHPIKFSVNS